MFFYSKHLRIIIWVFVGILLVYTRFINLSWGLPYPMHPDERNMAVAILQFYCHKEPSLNCLNPHFFAYGQLPLYLAYFLFQLWAYLRNLPPTEMTYSQAVMSLRFIAAVSSIVGVIVMILIIRLLVSKMPASSRHMLVFTRYFYLLSSLLFIFSPGLIQYAHFGTTESLLMMYYLLLIYFSLSFFFWEFKWEEIYFFNWLDRRISSSN